MEIETKEIEQGIVHIGNQVMGIQVTDGPSYERAAALLLPIKDMQKTIKNYFKPLKESAHKSWKVICDRENEELGKLEPIEKMLKDSMVQYQSELKRQADEEARRRAKEEDERRIREALEAEEEEKRIREAAQAVKSDTVRDILVKAAEEKKAEVDEILARPEPVVLPPPKVLAPEVKGIAYKTVWHHEVVDPALVPNEYRIIDEAKISATVRTMKDATSIPGVRVWSTQEIAAGGRR